MAFDLAAIRTGIADAITAAGFEGETYPVWADNLVTPCAIVHPRAGDYHLAMQKGSMKAPLVLTLVVSSVVTDEAQADLDAYCSSGTNQARSIIDALQHSQLGGACLDLHVLGFDDYGAIELGDERRMFGVTFNLDVYCDRK